MVRADTKSMALELKYLLFFFASAKKNNKSTPENENSPFSGEEV
jgi:hypothetical protein